VFDEWQLGRPTVRDEWLSCVLCRQHDDLTEVSVDGERHRVAPGRQEEAEAHEALQEIPVCTSCVQP